ncbi:unnamed protein product [Meganyctiphanes norvegica]|uniref:Uncharacterized protein n=1 Tax=Meganyctiphanes norvegica TaxID=48144 RepID=A0AAV2QSR0_MEGNR
MDKHQILLFLARLGIGVVTVVVGAAAQVTSPTLTCYECTDNPTDNYPYDPDCADYSYNVRTETWNVYDACYIRIYDDGYLERGIAGSGHEDGDCRYGRGADYTQCCCKGELCNTESFCSQCGYPWTSPPPPGASTTTEAATTPSPTVSLVCYQCNGCSSVDSSSTPVISDARYQSCVTTVPTSGIVSRNGSYDQHPDGECAQDSEIISCWCSSSLCNNINI